MTSIAFTSLFLGLVIGVQTVGVIVEGPVAAVEYELDGKPVARAVKKPWSTALDFGDELSPHELVARALDVRGNEIARARQWLNLPRPRAETEIVLERDGSHRVTGALLAWQSILGSRPLTVSASFDGRRLSVGDRRVSLPPHDATTPHLLTVEVEFVEGVRSRADVVLGGGSGEEAKSELTAIPVTLRTRRDRIAIQDLRDCFEKRGMPLNVVAVDEGPAQVVLVRDLSDREASKVLEGDRYVLQRDSELRFGDIRLSRKDRVRFLWPFARRYEDPVLSSDLFELTRDLTARSGSLHWLLTRLRHPAGSLPHQRFSDAAAVAGLEAFGSAARRAVVLVLGSMTDSSRYSPVIVRRYLERLRVPLFVWSLEDPASRPDLAGWGPVEFIGSVRRLRDTVEALRERLAAQHVVWIDGRHLPQDVALTEKGSAFLEVVR